MKRHIVIAFLAFSLLTAVGFSAPVQAGAPTTPLEKEIVKALWSLPHYGVFDNLYFEMNGNNVTLEGQALLEITKAQAAVRVGKIKGIGTVTNKIEVLPPSPSDDALRFALYRRIFGNQDLHRYSLGPDPSIHIIVSGQHVTITGMVDTQDDKQKVEVVAKSTPGILSFKNDLRLPK